MSTSGRGFGRSGDQQLRCYSKPQRRSRMFESVARLPILRMMKTQEPSLLVQAWPEFKRVVHEVSLWKSCFHLTVETTKMMMNRFARVLILLWSTEHL